MCSSKISAFNMKIVLLATRVTFYARENLKHNRDTIMEIIFLRIQFPSIYAYFKIIHNTSTMDGSLSLLSLLSAKMSASRLNSTIKLSNSH